MVLYKEKKTPNFWLIHIIVFIDFIFLTSTLLYYGMILNVLLITFVTIHNILKIQFLFPWSLYNSFISDYLSLFFLVNKHFLSIYHIPEPVSVKEVSTESEVDKQRNKNILVFKGFHSNIIAPNFNVMDIVCLTSISNIKVKYNPFSCSLSIAQKFTILQFIKYWFFLQLFVFVEVSIFCWW